MIHKYGALRGQKIISEAFGILYCIWYPLGDNENTGLCFDLADEDIDDAIALLQWLKETEPTRLTDEE